MTDFWFSEEETRAATTPVIRRIIQELKAGSKDKALQLCDDLREERIILHDFFADTCTALFSWIGRNLGEEILPAMFSACFAQSAQRQVLDLLGLGIDRELEAMMLARNAWIAHSCSGAGEHGGSFRLIEDDEKFTFLLDPCGSGGRLWRKGRYGPPCDFAVTTRAYPWAYNREGFPYYCIHCAYLNELIPNEHLGFMTWPVDPPRHPLDICKWHLYKDCNAVPDSYYARYNLVRQKRPETRKKAKARQLSEATIREIIRPTPQRIREQILRGDLRRARRIGEQMAGEFLFLHNLYVNMIAATLEFAAMRAGEERLKDIFRYIYETCVRRQIAEPLMVLDPPAALKFILNNLFLAATCGGSGLKTAKIRISEDEKEVVVSLDPCGSGGKLLLGGAYRPGSGRHIREKMENRLLRFLLKLPLPSSLLMAAMPYAVTYFTETRKPDGLRRTRAAYEWSGGRSDVPYYCCLCTASVQLSGCRWLSVTPPDDKHRSCIWRAKKIRD